jgi:2-keto-4-pentenoate hydratase
VRTLPAPDPEPNAAAFGLHGALLVGQRLARAEAPDDLAAAIARFSLTFCRERALVDHGRAGNVLGSPVRALGHPVETLAREPGAPPLATDEIVTTGTPTDARGLAPGQVWTTEIDGLPMPGLRLEIV